MLDQGDIKETYKRDLYKRPIKETHKRDPSLETHKDVGSR